MNGEIPTFNADPVTHLLASWRFGASPHFVCGQLGYELRRTDGRFTCVPMAPLNTEPWSLARVERLQNGIWMFHAENPLEGVGLFLSSRDAEFSLSQMKIVRTVMILGQADLRYLKFLEPLWPTIDQMEEAFWSEPIDGWDTQFRASVELMRRFKGARELYALPRLREDHPYAS